MIKKTKKSMGNDIFMALSQNLSEQSWFYKVKAICSEFWFYMLAKDNNRFEIISSAITPYKTEKNKLIASNMLRIKYSEEMLKRQ